MRHESQVVPTSESDQHPPSRPSRAYTLAYKRALAQALPRILVMLVPAVLLICIAYWSVDYSPQSSNSDLLLPTLELAVGIALVVAALRRLHRAEKDFSERMSRSGTK